MFIVWALVAMMGNAQAESLPGDPIAGRALAGHLCVDCHDVAASEERVRPARGPSFLRIAHDPALDQRQLRKFLQTPHQAMPRQRLTPAEIDDVVSFIMALRG